MPQDSVTAAVPAGARPGQGRISSRISTQLIALLLSVFLIFITSVSVTGYMLHRHESALRGLFTVDFERAMLAGELARDAEVLSAQIFERMLGGQKSTVDGPPAVKNQMSILRNSHDRLAAVADPRSSLPTDLERLQRDYFTSIEALERALGVVEAHRQAHADQLDTLLALQADLNAPMAAARRSPQQQAVGHALQALAASIAAGLAAVAPGQLRQLEALAVRRLEELQGLLVAARIAELGPVLPRLTRELQSLSRAVFAARAEALVSERASLAMARETRVIAQKLGGVAVNHYLELREGARQAMADQAAAVRRALLFVIIFAAVSTLASMLAIAYIIRRIAWRLRDLNLAMHTHVTGQRVEIPCQGGDEIAEMGRAFEVFVMARDAAEKELRHNQGLLAKAAVTDVLSGLPNRRGFDETLLLEWRRCARNGDALALLMVDIDFFKAYNDHYGHLDGDACIRQVGALMRQSFDRSGDYPARYGGEEFVCILPRTEAEGAAAAAERFRLALIAAAIPHAASGVAECITASIGVASLRPGAEQDPPTIVAAADAALYRAKQQGRNRVVLG